MSSATANHPRLSPDGVRPKTGALLAGFGGPRSLYEIQPMLTEILGRTPPEALLERTMRKYQAIGGSSPFVGIATMIARGIESMLMADRDLDVECIQPGMLFTAPKVESSIFKLVSSGCSRIMFLALTPFYSQAAYGTALARVQAALQAFPRVQLIEVPVVGTAAAYRTGVIARVREAYAGAGLPTASASAESCGRAQQAEQIGSADPAALTRLVFVAHSLPTDDPDEDAAAYDACMRTLAASVAAAVGGMDEMWRVAYTSQGARGGAWLGPTMTDVLQECADDGVGAVVACPLGFLVDHMEVLYDLDVQAAADARELGIRFVRAGTLGASRDLIEAYIEVMRRAESGVTEP
ncbi:MAG: ferrochelatase [Actinomycetes bacterium]|jgi:ferrochelatase|nr:ferrochelatase [Actinomycetes bacterium]